MVGLALNIIAFAVIITAVLFVVGFIFTLFDL